MVETDKHADRLKGLTRDILARRLKQHAPILKRVPGLPPRPVVVSVDEIEALLDRLDEVEARLAFDRSRGEETVPDAVVGRLLAGENPVRVWREHRGKGLRGLAGEIGVSPGHLSQIETGAKGPSLELLQRLAAALQVDLDDLT